MQDWEQKLSNKQHYDLQAPIYDVQYIEEQDAKIESIIKNVEFDSNELVLDLGCGTGFLFPHICEKAGFIVGMDLSKKALLCAKKRTKNMANVELVCADADNTPFVDNLFDKVFAVTVLQNMPDPKKTIEEIKRVGKPHAMLAVTGLKKKYTQESFVQMLSGAQLKTVKLITTSKLKGHLVLCTNT